MSLWQVSWHETNTNVVVFLFSYTEIVGYYFTHKICILTITFFKCWVNCTCFFCFLRLFCRFWSSVEQNHSLNLLGVNFAIRWCMQWLVFGPSSWQQNPLHFPEKVWWTALCFHLPKCVQFSVSWDFLDSQASFWDYGAGIEWVKWHMVMKLEKEAVNKTGVTSEQSDLSDID